MRRRERYAGVVWLDKLARELAGEVYPGPQPMKGGITHNVDYLVHNLGLLVEVEGQEGHYRLRCFPTPRSVALGAPYVAASYSGPNLGSIPAAAVEDYLAVGAYPAGNRYSAREVVRWVPS